MFIGEGRREVDLESMGGECVLSEGEGEGEGDNESICKGSKATK